MDWSSNENAGSEAEPMDPVVREAAAAWAQRTDRRELVEVKGKPEAPAEPAAERPVPSVRGGYGHTPVTYQILEEAMRGLVKRERKARNEQIDAIVTALVKKFEEVGDVFGEARSITTLRFVEAERRIAELEARIAQMEGRSDG